MSFLTEFTGFRGPMASAAANLYRAARHLDGVRRSLQPHIEPKIPTISVGNITVGGTGKTPAVVDLCRRVHDWGYTPVVLSRGYGGSEPGPRRVDPEGSAQRFGDEPVMLARQGINVWIAKSRGEAVELAQEDGDLLILDDGFQRVEIERNLDLVTFGPYGLGNGKLLPAGILRDPVKTLGRADAFLGNVASVKDLFPDTPRFACGVRGLRFDPGLPAKGLRVAAVAAIAYPSQFFATLRENGLTPILEQPLPDHDPIRDTTLRDLERAWNHAAIDAVVCTEKDAVKLGPMLRKRRGAPVLIAARAQWGPVDDRTDHQYDRFLRTRLNL